MVEARFNQERNGVEIDFSARPSEEILSSLRSAGFRWSPRQKLWYAKDNPERRALAEKLAGSLEIMEEKRSYAEIIDEKRDRAASRQERLQTKAARLETESRTSEQRAKDILDYIPMGQPILVGHHSEKRHRRDLARADSAMRKSWESQKAAKDAQEKAAASADHQARMERPDVIQRRILKLETDKRYVERRIKSCMYTLEHGGISKDGWEYQNYNPEAAKKAIEDDRALLTSYQEKIDYWQGVLDASGAKIYGPSDFKPGQKVKTRSLGLAVIKRVNAKTLSVRYLNPALGPLFDDTIGYDRIIEVL